MFSECIENLNNFVIKNYESVDVSGFQHESAALDNTHDSTKNE